MQRSIVASDKMNNNLQILPNHNQPRIYKTAFHTNENWSHVLICFPWAGGGKASFSSLCRALRSQTRLVLYTVAYSPNDSVQNRPATVGEMADVVYPEIKTLLKSLYEEKVSLRQEKPLVSFFGFSYGGLLAYEVMQRIEADNQSTPWKEMIYTFRGLSAAEKLGERIQLQRVITCAVASPLFLTTKNASLQQSKRRYIFIKVSYLNYVNFTVNFNLLLISN